MIGLVRRICLRIGLLLSAWIAAPTIAQPVGNDPGTLIAIDVNGTGDASASADGQIIVASSTRLRGESAIWLFDRKSASWRQLTKGGNGDREPAISPDARTVIFVSDRNEQTDLWAVDVASGREFRLTDNKVEEEYPAWSHDGKELVFTGGSWKARNFYTLKFSDRSEKLSMPKSVLSKSGHVGACRFKTDGKLICHVYDGNAADVLEVDQHKHQSNNITRGGWWYFKPDVSPEGWVAVTVIGDDGDTIRFLPNGSKGDPLPTPSISGRWPQFVNNGRELFYHRQVTEGAGMKLVDLSNGRSKDLKVNGQLSGFASISPDGQLVAYCQKQKDVWETRIRDLKDDSDRVVPLGREACNPAWSPDGKRLAISFREGDRWSQAVVGIDGSGLQILRQGNSVEWQLNAPAAWSPDGTQIVFAATTAPYESDIYVASLSTNSVRNITNDSWYDEGPSWSKDGKSVVFMSTRGGNWTWGLFAMAPNGGSATTLITPDSVERRFPQLDLDGAIWWIESDLCLGAAYVVQQTASKRQKFFDFPGASWISRSGDGKNAVVSITRRRVEYWSRSVGHREKIANR
jgi:TolB protein